MGQDKCQIIDLRLAWKLGKGPDRRSSQNCRGKKGDLGWREKREDPHDGHSRTTEATMGLSLPPHVSDISYLAPPSPASADYYHFVSHTCLPCWGGGCPRRSHSPTPKPSTHLNGPGPTSRPGDTKQKS